MPAVFFSVECQRYFFSKTMKDLGRCCLRTGGDSKAARVPCRIVRKRKRIVMISIQRYNVNDRGTCCTSYFLVFQYVSRLGPGRWKSTCDRVLRRWTGNVSAQRRTWGLKLTVLRSDQNDSLTDCSKISWQPAHAL